FSHPNVLAGYLLISLVFLYSQRSYFRTVLTRVLLLTGMLVGTLGLFVTLSRLPIILWVCFLLVVFIRVTVRVLFQASTRNPLPFRRIISRGGIVLATGVLAVLLVVPFVPMVTERFLTST